MLTPKQIKKEYLHDKMTMAQIGERHGISAMAVCGRLKRMGVKTRVAAPYMLNVERGKKNKKRVIEAWKRHDGKIQLKDLAKELGLCTRTVARHLNPRP